MLPARNPRRVQAPLPATVMEQHYSVAEIAKKWRMGESTVYEIFRDEPGVIRKTKEVQGKRTYGLLRVPESVARRVYEGMVIGR
jgi:hypothetical protein